MEILGKMTPLEEMDIKELNNEGCIRLMCQIAQLASEEYKNAYAHYISHCMECNKEAATEARVRMKSRERDLKGPILDLNESQIISLQMQVEKSKRIATFKDTVRQMYSQGQMTKHSLTETFGLLPSILKRWLK